MVSKALGKYVQSLHQKKYRHRHGAFLVEGGKSVLELLSSDLEVEHVLATAEFIDQNRARHSQHLDQAGDLGKGQGDGGLR